MKKNKLLLITLLLMMNGTIACKNKTEKPEIRVAEVTHSIFYAPQYVSKNLGYFADEGIEVNLTIDREQEGWDGHVGFVPNYVKELNPDIRKTVLMCGPPIMIKFTLAGLKELGFQDTQVYTTMELRMKCGIGKCGRCNIGSKYVCKDGPVFRFDQLGELPNEY